MYLVVNENKNAYMLPWVDRYKIFLERDAAAAHARSIGFEDMFGLGVTTKVGVANVYMCGDVSVKIINLGVS